MRDSLNLKNVKFLHGYTYEGVYYTDNEELYVKLQHDSGVWLNVPANKLNTYIYKEFENKSCKK